MRYSDLGWVTLLMILFVFDAHAESGPTDAGPPCDASGITPATCTQDASVLSWCSSGHKKQEVCGADRCRDVAGIGDNCIAVSGERCAHAWYDGPAESFVRRSKPCVGLDGGTEGLACDLENGCIALATTCVAGDEETCIDDLLLRRCGETGQPSVVNCADFGGACSNEGFCSGVQQGSVCGSHMQCAEGLGCGRPNRYLPIRCNPVDCDVDAFEPYCVDAQNVARRCTDGVTYHEECPCSAGRCYWGAGHDCDPRTYRVDTCEDGLECRTSTSDSQPRCRPIVDAGSISDAGEQLVDGGPVDAGEPDGGVPSDASAAADGGGGRRAPAQPCACSGAGGGRGGLPAAAVMALVGVSLLWRRRSGSGAVSAVSK